MKYKTLAEIEVRKAAILQEMEAEGADLEEIRRKIVEMPNYFADYDTTVTFVTLEELRRDHSALERLL